MQTKPWWKIQLFVWEPVLFGTWDGVFTSCMINIFGVVLFLRTGWLVVSADRVEHSPPHLLTSRILHHSSVWDSVVFTVGTAYVRWYFVAFLRLPLKWEAEVAFVSNCLF